ncbi:hypothetical protein LK09_12070 [Microbacterium mangrovi]|uniref:DUF3515 domain-containing protein n=1 Tax=Microbacterium mangrovi TaxID=1348253 RepID=A0A0B2A7Q3_9MICO|nr:hypothetical protein LK09_12070 [Microbacterium mangrovi]
MRPSARSRRALRISASVVGAVVLAAGLAGCAATISLNPPPHADDPRCAEVMTDLTALSGGTLGGQDRRWTDAQSTAAWGNPATIILACGVTPPGPTTLKCVSIGGVDWIVDSSKTPKLTVTTYGRTPAVQLFLDSSAGSGVDPNEVLDTVGRLVAQDTRQTAQCTNPATNS